eukprot:582243-Prorocentrum_minimum.AAC.1
MKSYLFLFFVSFRRVTFGHTWRAATSCWAAPSTLTPIRRGAAMAVRAITSSCASSPASPWSRPP